MTALRSHLLSGRPGAADLQQRWHSALTVDSGKPDVQQNDFEIASREFQEVKTQLLNALTNHGRPFIFVKDGNYRNRGELYLLHQYEGIELKQDYAQDTLANLQKLWRRPVHIETAIDDKPSILSFDGTSHEVREK